MGLDQNQLTVHLEHLASPTGGPPKARLPPSRETEVMSDLEFLGGRHREETGETETPGRCLDEERRTRRWRSVLIWSDPWRHGWTVVQG